MVAEGPSRRAGVLVAGGLAALLWGQSLSGSYPGPPTCHGQPMGTADVCRISDTFADGGTYDYPQMMSRDRARSHRLKLALEWGGGAAAVAGAVVVAVAL